MSLALTPLHLLEPMEPETRASLLERARRLRSAAESLEAEAGVAGGVGDARSGNWADVLHGDWGALRAESVRIDAATHSNRHEIAVAAAIQAVVGALTGHEEIARTAAVRAESIAPDESGIVAGVSIARAVTWLANGNARAAFDTMAELWEQRGHDAAPVVGIDALLAEAALRARREREGRAMLRNAATASRASVAATEESALATAILSIDEADGVARALLAESTVLAPFAKARLHLALGMWLRRHHRPMEAVRHVQIALDHFVGLDALPWIRTAQGELRASGVRQPGRGDQRLSDQQVQIALLAARGFTNRDIAERLFLSPRTVSSHLYRIYPKLGISSRHQLASKLAARAREDPPHLSP